MNVEIPLEVRLDRLDQYIGTLALLVAIFCTAVDAPAWGGPLLTWAWKGIVVVAAYYKGLHTDKPEPLTPGIGKRIT